MKKKIIIGSAALVLLVGIAVTALLLSRERLQQITLPNGTKLTLLGVTTGKRHTPPLDHHIPRRIRFNTPDDSLCVWLREEFSKPPGAYGVFGFNQKADFCVGRGIFRRYPTGKGTNIVTVRFASFPREEGKMRLRPDAQRSTNASGEFAISFPIHASVTNWQPASLPATYEDGDVSVTLTKLVSGVPLAPGLQQSTNLMDKGVSATFQISEEGVPAKGWQLVQIESSDATGNHSLAALRNPRRALNEISVNYPCTLSPDAAWKVRAELVRVTGFPEDETWTVGDIPASQDSSTNEVTKTDFGDSTVTIFPANITENPAETQLRVQVTPPPTPDLHLALISAVDEKGVKLAPSRTPSSPGNFVYSFKRTDVKALQIKLALHRSRFVEFIAKPVKQ